MKNNINWKKFAILVSLLPLWILWRNIFPVKNYYFHKNVGNGLRIITREIKGDQFLIFPFEDDGLAGRLRVKADFEGIEEGKLILAKNYEAVFYPWGEDIKTVEQLKEIIFFKNETDIPNGTLMADEQAVYVIVKGKKYPFISPEVFERLGYQWEKISASPIPSEMFLGENLNLQAAHPEGTIFRDENEKFFLFWEGEKRRVERSLIEQVWPDFFWIKLSSAESFYFNVCSGERSFWGNRLKFDCVFDIKNEKGNSNIFLAKMDFSPAMKIRNVHSKTITSFLLDPKKNVSLFLTKTRNRLATRYGFLFN